MGERRVQMFVNKGRSYAHDGRYARDRVFSRKRSGVEIIPPERMERVCGEREIEKNDFLLQDPDAEHR